MLIVVMTSACATRKRPDVVPTAPAPPSVESSTPGEEAPTPKANAPKSAAGSSARSEKGARERERRGADIPLSRRTQTGYATYLARSFHGRESASGERFDTREMVAAHRSLPFGTIVRVTNLENARSVTVRIIDRGPYGKNFREGTIIDLSRAAARRVGMLRDGQVLVRLVIIRLAETTHDTTYTPDESPTPPLPRRSEGDIAEGARRPYS